MTPSKPRQPAGLGAAGKALWKRIATPFDLEPAEVALLETACRQADDVAALEVVLAAEGMTVAGSVGQTRLNPAVPELRQGRLALGKLLGQLALPDVDDKPASAASQRARRAADSRWDRVRRQREAQERGVADGSA